MATTEIEKPATKKDELTGEDLVYSPEKDDYVPAKMSRELYQQRKREQSRQAVTAGGLALAGEVGQFLVGLSVMDDPTVKSARRDLARLEAETKKSGPTMSESEKNRYREALNAPVQRAQEQLQRRAEAIAASTGDKSARTFLKAAESGLDRVRQQALQTEAVIAKEQVRRDTERDIKIDKARKEADQIRAMFLDLRNTYVREPLHKFIGDAAKYVGTVAAYAPGKDFSAEFQAAKDANVTPEQMRKLRRMSQGPFAEKRVAKYLEEIGVSTEAKPTAETGDEAAKEMTRDVSQERKAEEPEKAEAVEELVDPNDSSYQYKRLPDGSYEVRRRQADGSYKRTGTAKKGSAAFDAIDDLFPEDAPLSEDEQQAAVEGFDFDTGTDEDARRALGLSERSSETRESEPDPDMVALSESLKADMEKTRLQEERIAAQYDKATELPGMGPLYKKGRYFYGFRDGVWTVYPSMLAYASNRPLEEQGKPVQFSLEETKNNKNPNVRELFILADQEMLVN